MSLIAVHRTSSLIRLTLAAVLALPSTGAMPAGALPVDGVVYGCPMGGHVSGRQAMRGMHAAADGRPVGRTGDIEPGPPGDDGDGCHCCRECGCPVVPEAATPPAVALALAPAIIARFAPFTPKAPAPRRTPRTLLPPPTGPPAFSA